MPKPKKNESKQDFLSRCTKEVMESEGKETDQAYAMCNAFWDKAKGTRNVLSLSAPFQLVQKDGAKEDEKKEFLITAYTGQAIQGWWGKIVFDVTGMKTKAKYPVLREHERDRVVGIGTKAWNDGKNFYMGGEFAENTKDGDEVLSLAQQGFPWQASVGIWPKQVLELKDEKESAEINGSKIYGPAEVWLESLVGEVSFVSLGADDQTAAITLSDQSVPVSVISSRKFNDEEDEVMDYTIELLEKEAPALLAEIRSLAEKTGLDKERGRVAAILEADADPAVTKKAITDGVSAEGAFKLFYVAEKEKRAAALLELETSAPSPAGAVPPKEPEKLKSPQAELMAKAKALAVEKKITVAQAMRQLQVETPDLLDAGLPKMHVVVND